MIQFSDLNFVLCPNHPDGNSKAFLAVGEYQVDIIKKPKTRTYKVKPFETVHGKKRYRGDLFEEYGFPEFKTRDALIEFLNTLEDLDDGTED